MLDDLETFVAIGRRDTPLDRLHMPRRLGASLIGLPDAVAQWNAHPSVMNWKSAMAALSQPIVGSIARTIASFATDGLSEIAIGLHQLSALISPAAWLGVSRLTMRDKLIQFGIHPTQAEG